MSKKSQTTGLPKRRRRTAAAAENAAEQGTAEYKTRAEQEAQVQQRVVRGIGALVAILLVLIAIAFAIEQLVIPNQVLAVVNGENITVGEFRAEYQLERSRILLQLNQIQSIGIELDQISQQEPYRSWISEVNVPDQLGLRVINDMVDDRLLAQAAAARDITVDEAAVRAEVEDFFGFDPTEVALIGVEATETPTPTITPTPFVSPTPSSTPTLTPTPTETPTPTPTSTPDPDAAETDDETDADGEPTPDATETGDEADSEPTITPQPTVVEPTLSADEVRENFEESEANYRAYFARAGVSSETVDLLFERSALENLLAEALVGADGTLLYADVRHILVEDEAEALEVLAALQSGESFAELARAVSTDPGSGSRGGELGDAYVGNYVPEFRAAIENAEIGALVGPVKSEFGFHIIQVRSKEERSGDEIASQLERAQQQEFDRFVETLREENSGDYEIYDAWIDYVPGS